MRKGIMALEGLEIQEEIVDGQVDGTPQVDFIDAPENDTLDMNEAECELQGLDDDSSHAEAVADTLGEMKDALGASVETGGMSEPEARAIEIVVEHLRTSVGFSGRSKSMPSMEAFADKTSRVRATKHALESIEATDKAIWAGIVHAFESAIAWVKKFWASMSAAVAKYAERANQMIKSAGEKAKAGGEAAKVSASSFAKTLNVGGKVVAGKEFVSKYTAYVTSFGSSDASAEAAKVEKYGQAVITLVSSQSDDAAFQAATKAVADAKAGLLGSTEETKEVFGQVSRFVSGADDKSAFIKMGPSTGAVPVEGDSIDIDALSAKEIMEVATAAKKHLDVAAAWAAAADRIEKIQGQVSAACKSATSKEANGERAKQVAAVARSFVSTTSSGLASVHSHAVNVSKAALDYCGVSMKGAPAAEAAAPAA